MAQAQPVQPVVDVVTNATDHGPCHVAQSKNASEEAEKLQKKYEEERNKRLRSDGLSQYLNLSSTENPKIRRYLDDPWDDGSISSIPLQDGAHTKILIVGAGFGGLMFAVELIRAGIPHGDILMVDQAAGFGGAWYWNRYAGLMCDVDSTVYMPLLEETGYRAKHKYAYGEELREHAERIATKYKLRDRAMFRSEVHSSQWDDTTKMWKLKLTQRSPNSNDISAAVSADFVIFVPGLFTRPKVPNLSGLETYSGKSFLTSRWDYEVTGGNQENPSLENLRDKRVGIIGTGATALQAVPHLAKWSKHLYVFQRTPSSVDVRRQKTITDAEWANVTKSGPGWQAVRSRNFTSFTARVEPLPEIDMISDGWTDFPSYHVLTGGGKPVTSEMVAAHIADSHRLDLPRMERIRARVDQEVKDPAVAEKLKPWYAGWCKRPGFHDDYLSTFNKPNVELIDTAGRGVDAITTTGVQANGQVYDVDVLIFSTGFESGFHLDPGSRCGIEVIGREGRRMADRWEKEGTATLHGIMSRGFPNLFFTGTPQSGVSPNYTPSLEIFSRHTAYIISEVEKKRAVLPELRVAAEPHADAEKAWVMGVLAGAYSLAPLGHCTPSYFNAESDVTKLPMEEQVKGAVTAAWPGGINDYLDILQAWREAGDLSGLSITLTSK
ncbi:monooxygenase [Pseudovirgaria hyperparasitica]|uniref:Monooxygenase n=1 Tax=Pseudovirgaria hyperparasitica TaxID=470096 RepID=A0A6A6WGD7_9PEZI|nr:monooxygenase [Pseudovirgaria hyperparasitica]KAF2761843.1 monooxygenase [Pseudovirgaria hyperparasitica]